MKIFSPGFLLRAGGALLVATVAVFPGVSAAQTVPGFHFQGICRSDPAASKNTVTVVLHGPDQQDTSGAWVQDHAPLAGVTVNVLWSFVAYRQNRAVFKYRPDSCVTARDGSCTFHGGSGRARWQLAGVAGYTMDSPTFDTDATAACPNSLMIDFW